MYSSQKLINNQLYSPIIQRKQSFGKINSMQGNSVQGNKYHSSKSISISKQLNKTTQVLPSKNLNPQISVSQQRIIQRIEELRKRVKQRQDKNTNQKGIQPLQLISKMNKTIDQLTKENDNLSQRLEELTKENDNLSQKFQESAEKLTKRSQQSQQLLKFIDKLQSQNQRLQTLIKLTTHVKQSEYNTLKQQLELTKLQKQESENCMKQMASELSVLRLLRQKINRQENQNIGLCKFCINKKAIFVNVLCGHLLLCQDCVQFEVCKRKCLLCDAEGKYVKLFSSLLRE